MNSKNIKKLFLWGAATSSYQVEGYCENNDWNLWENSKKPDGSPCILNSDKAGTCTDHWNRYKDDIILFKKMGGDAYRFSLEWSKIEIEPGIWNQEAIDHYKEKCRFLIDNEMVPFVTLHHFTSPIWFFEKGGFETEYGIERFLIFVDKIVSELAPFVKFWCTINEPIIYVRNGWIESSFPPGKLNVPIACNVYKNMLIAHAKGYKIIHVIYKNENLEKPEVGLAKSVQILDPVDVNNSKDLLATKIIDDFHNMSFLNSFNTGKLKLEDENNIYVDQEIEGLKGSLDWFGVNYYAQDLVTYDSTKPLHFSAAADPRQQKTDMGWGIYPEGMYRSIQMVEDLNVPIYITENGIATDDGKLRKQYTHDHITQMIKAKNDGFDVRGYFHWSLIDNFEWAHGFRPHFGLFSYDSKTFERKLKPGSDEYVKLIEKYR